MLLALQLSSSAQKSSERSQVFLVHLYRNPSNGQVGFSSIIYVAKNKDDVFVQSLGLLRGAMSLTSACLPSILLSLQLPLFLIRFFILLHFILGSVGFARGHIRVTSWCWRHSATSQTDWSTSCSGYDHYRWVLCLYMRTWHWVIPT